MIMHFAQRRQPMLSGGQKAWAAACALLGGLGGLVWRATRAVGAGELDDLANRWFGRGGLVFWLDQCQRWFVATAAAFGLRLAPDAEAREDFGGGKFSPVASAAFFIVGNQADVGHQLPMLSTFRAQGHWRQVVGAVFQRKCGKRQCEGRQRAAVFGWGARMLDMFNDLRDGGIEVQPVGGIGHGISFAKREGRYGNCELGRTLAWHGMIDKKGTYVWR